MVGARGGLGGGPGGGAGFFRARRNAKSRNRPRTMAIRTATTMASDDCRVRLTVRVSLAWAPKGSSTSTRTRTLATAMSGVIQSTAVSPRVSLSRGIVWVPTGTGRRRVAQDGVPGLPIERATPGRVELDAVHDDVPTRGRRVHSAGVSVDELQRVPSRRQPRGEREVLPDRRRRVEDAA